MWALTVSDVGDRELRTAALGGHVARCEDCAYTTLPTTRPQPSTAPVPNPAAAKEWLAYREADLFPVPYYTWCSNAPLARSRHRLPKKAVVYDLLFKSRPRPCGRSPPTQSSVQGRSTSGCTPGLRLLPAPPHGALIGPGRCNLRPTATLGVLSARSPPFRDCSWRARRSPRGRSAQFLRRTIFSADAQSSQPSWHRCQAKWVATQAAVRRT